MFKILIALLLLPAFAMAKSDIVPRLTVTGPAVRTATGDFEVPVRVSMRNAGIDVAGRFKIHIEWSNTSFSGTRLTSFAKIISTDNAFSLYYVIYVLTNRAMMVGNSFSFNGNVRIPKSVQLKSLVQLRIVADSCAGDEFMPAFCRVDELREDNNLTPFVNVTMPTL
jgi:hypothetical protein